MLQKRFLVSPIWLFTGKILRQRQAGPVGFPFLDVRIVILEAGIPGPACLRWWVLRARAEKKEVSSAMVPLAF